MRHLRRKWLFHGSAKEASAIAVVNHGRWIVRCPFCPNALDAFHPDWQCAIPKVKGKTIPHVRDRFMCHGPSACSNAAAGGRWVAVLWPPAHELLRGMQVLAARADPATRNWEPFVYDEGAPGGILLGETVEFLSAENEAHGLAA